MTEIMEAPVQPQETSRGVLSSVANFAKRAHIEMVLRSPGFTEEPSAEPAAESGTEPHRLRRNLTIAGIGLGGAALALEALKAAGVPVPAPSDLLHTGITPPTKVPTPKPVGWS